MAWADTLKKMNEDLTREKLLGNAIEKAPTVKEKDPRQKETYYSNLLESETDPVKKARLKAQLDAAGLPYTEKAQTVIGSNRISIEQPRSLYATDNEQYLKYKQSAEAMGNAAMPEEMYNRYAEEKRISELPEKRMTTAQARREDFLMSKFPSTIGTTPIGSISNSGGLYYGTSGKGATGGTQSLLEQQRQARLNTAQTGLQSTRENVLSNLSTKKSEIDPRIAQSRASAVSGTTIAQKRLADLIPFSGAMAGSQVSKGEELNTDLQNRQSTLDVEREQSFKDISNQETEAERSYQQGLAMADAQAQEQYLTEQLANARTQEERAYAQQQLNDQRAYNAQLTAQEQAYQQQLTAQQQAYQQQQTASERAYAEQQNKAQQDREDYLMNIGQFSQNYQKEINNLLAQGVPETDYRVMALRNQRTQKLGAMAEAEQNAYVQAMKDEQAKQEQAFELAKWRFNNGLPATQMDAQLLGVRVGQVSPAQSIKNAELQLSKQKESRVASKSSGGSSGSSSSTQQKSPVTLTDYEQALKRTFTENDTPETQSKKAAEFIIKNKGVLSDSIIQRLATRYNVTEQMIQDYVNMEKFNVMKNL